jgi:NitT/TauT family transport system ATP-binding protein
MTPAVRFDRVAKRYGGRKVLNDLSFEIAPREVVGLLGPSGIGKSTVLKLVAGLERPTGGEVRVQARRIGYVFQEPRLLPWKTSLENVVLPLKATGLQKGKAVARATRLLEAMALSEFMDSYPAQLSGGMCQRVSLARAFAVEPDILLLDEPFSSLDIEMKEGLHAMLVERLTAQPATVLYVSHSPGEVKRIADRIFTLPATGPLKEYGKRKSGQGTVARESFTRGVST